MALRSIMRVMGVHIINLTFSVPVVGREDYYGVLYGLLQNKRDHSII